VPRTTAEVEFPQAATVSFFFRRQEVHLLYLAALLPVARGLAAPALGNGAWLGLTDTSWFALCLGVAVVHQVYVWIAWRAQLGWKVFTRVFGWGDFAAYNAVFFPLLLLRPLLVAATSVADAGTLRLPVGLALGLGALLSLPALYTGWSVAGTSGSRERRAAITSASLSECRSSIRASPDAERHVHARVSGCGPSRSLPGHMRAWSRHSSSTPIWVHYLHQEPDMEVLYGRAARHTRVAPSTSWR
jgi:hypothetical protein